jgi:nucleoside-diphosphate-sugar epimerase
LNVLESCRRRNREANIVLTGTVTQVGPACRLPVDETVTGCPVSVYDAHKALCEHYLAIYHRVFGLRTTTLRLSNVFGERQQVTDTRRGIVNVMIKRAMLGEPITVYGDGMFLRDYNYVQNVVDACLLAAASPRTKGASYVIGSGIGTRFVDMMKKIVDIVEDWGPRRAAIHFMPFPEDQAKIDQGDFVVDSTRFHEATGWTPIISLDHGLAATVRFYQERLADYIGRGNDRPRPDLIRT